MAIPRLQHKYSGHSIIDAPLYTTKLRQGLEEDVTAAAKGFDIRELLRT
jgi:hypothetical protein